MNPNLILGVSLGAYMSALVVIAFAFYYLGKNKTITVNLFQVAGLLFLTLITAAGDPASNYALTIGAITFGYFATATVSYILGYTGRQQPIKK